MTAKLEMSDEAYAVLKEDIDGVKTVAVQVRGLVPNHIWSRIDYLADDLASILRDGVDIVKDEDDEETAREDMEREHPDLERAMAQAEDAQEEIMDFRRHHINLDADPVHPIFANILKSVRPKEKSNE